jgi:hypothetical protein
VGQDREHDGRAETSRHVRLHPRARGGAASVTDGLSRHVRRRSRCPRSRVTSPAPVSRRPLGSRPRRASPGRESRRPRSSPR